MIQINNDQVEVKQLGIYYCWLSGWTESVRPKGWNAEWKLQIAHIASGSGRAHRVNDRRAVTLLSPLCHQLHVSNSDSHPTMVINGVQYKTIDERHTLWIKRQIDPDFWDEEFLQQIWIGKLPAPEPPPSEWNKIFMDNTGIIRTH